MPSVRFNGITTTGLDPIVFLVDVDNTLLDNDRIQDDIQAPPRARVRRCCRDRYWTIQERLFVDLGYRDYLGALQVYRAEYPEDVQVLTMSSYLLDYPFGDRLYPGALEVLERLARLGAHCHPDRRRRRVPAAQGRALRAFAGGGRPRADLCPQGAGAG